jgi:serine/threonine protein kinase
MSKEALNILNGMLIMDPNERLTAMDALAHSYFDPIREPEVDQMIMAHR